MNFTRLRRAREVTLGLIKPTVASSPNVSRNIIERIHADGFNIVDAKKVHFSHDQARAFYGEHEGKAIGSFKWRLTKFQKFRNDF